MREISMNEVAADESAALTSGRILPLLLIMFVGSGCAALIYEVVWFQLLELVIGSSTVSMGILLGTFMGGMCLGSLLFPRIVSRRLHPLRVYAVMELGIAAIGLVLLFGMPLINGIYTAWAASGFRRHGSARHHCRHLPTAADVPDGRDTARDFAMGRDDAARRFLAWLFLRRKHRWSGDRQFAGRFLPDARLRHFNHDVRRDGIERCRRAAQPGSFEVDAVLAFRAESERIVAARAWPIYLSIALSGMTALACEVLWTRTLSLLFGATVYTFSLIVAVFLVGLGIGSTLGSALSHQMKRPRVALAWCQLLLCAAMGWAAYMLTESLPWWPIDPSISSTPVFTLQLDLVRTLWVVLPGRDSVGREFPAGIGCRRFARPGSGPSWSAAFMPQTHSARSWDRLARV